jgi:SET domain-containing protein
MSFRINPPTKIYVDKSPIHGWGVFASQDIETGEIIEEVPVLELPINKGEVTSLLIDYRFNWPQGVEWDKQVVGLGFASLYNHSNDANAYWVSDLEKNTFKFISNKKISSGDEIFIWYGDVNYWNDGRNHISVVE